MRYFISGHIDITQEQFNNYYKDKIINAANEPDSTFVMGSAPGADFMAQQLLVELLGYDEKSLDRIRVYHRGDSPECLADSRLKTIGGFKSHNEKDATMTLNSDIDIAWIRPANESVQLYGEKYNPNRISGTQKNLERREKMKKKMVII